MSKEKTVLNYKEHDFGFKEKYLHREETNAGCQKRKENGSKE